MAKTKHQPKQNEGQAHRKPSLKLGLGLAGTIILCAVVGASAQNLLKGNVFKQVEAKPNSDLVDRYGDAAADPAVADALRKVQGDQIPDVLKEKSDTIEALQNGIFRPGADPTMALMYGYVPPNMSPEQARILSQNLPHLSKMPGPMSPEQMAGETESRMTMIEPMSPYIPYPESFAKSNGLSATRPMQRIPQQSFSNQMAGMTGMPYIPGMSMVGAGAGLQYGLSKAEIAVQNQRIAEESLRAYYGPIDMQPVHRDHAWLAEHAKKTKTANGYTWKSDRQSVIGVCDASGNEITSIQYDPWGNQTVLNGGTVMPDIGFQGMYMHQPSGLYLTQFRAYSPKLGRWLSRDPLGESAGTNLFAFVGNNPISYIDPLGLDALYGYGGIGGLHRGLFIQRDDGSTVTINGGYSGRGFNSFTGNLTLNIRDDQRRPTDNPWSPVDRKPITTNQCQIDKLFENAKQLQNRLQPNNRPVPYALFVPAISGGRTSNQVVPLLLESAGIPVPLQPISPGYDVPFGDTDPGLM